FDLRAAERVIDLGGGGSSDRVLVALQGLRDKSLLLRTDEGPTARYGMLLSIRAYAEERLEDEGDVAAVLERHAAHYAHVSSAVSDLDNVIVASQRSARLLARADLALAAAILAAPSVERRGPFS